MQTILLITILFIGSSLSFNTYQLSVKKNVNDQLYVVRGLDTSAIAYGTFEDGLNVTGWGVLKLQTNSAFDDVLQMKAAGFLEGALTADRIYQNYVNTYNTFFSKAPPSPKVIAWLKEQDSWTRNNIGGNFNGLTSYWKQVAFIVAQFDGLMEGYHSQINQTERALDLFDFQMLNGCGDLFDIIPAVDLDKRINWDHMTWKEAERHLASNGHCSALIKVDGDFSDLWVGHSSWFTYSAMNRIFKHYNFGIKANFVSAKKMSFSSYPGFLVSLDDFYIMDNGISMVQTTNSIIDQSLYDKVTPHSLLAWQRVRLANHMASTGMEWGSLFSQHNSGTYTNQYMVVDWSKFQRGIQLEDGLLTVVEQIPGYIEYADQTQQLERGYWPSYNVAFYPKIYNMSGYPELVKKFGILASYQMAPRAQIFRRDQNSVVDMETFKAILRYNDYLHDPYSEKNPGNAICSRFDLEGFASGCYDTKVTSFDLASKMISHAINGPTTSHDLPPFRWTSEFNQTLHLGQPQLFNFDFVEMNPKW